MKKILCAGLMLLMVGLVSIPEQAVGQQASTKISYQVTFGPVFPIEGVSNQVKGQIALNDTTQAVEQIGFEVPLNSFIGQNAGYLAWVGNSWTFPDMRFRSKSIEPSESGLLVKGTVELRGRTAPVSIEFTRTENKDEWIFAGDFNLPAHDYFIISPAYDLVPNRIPMEVTLVFPKPIAG